MVYTIPLFFLSRVTPSTMPNLTGTSGDKNPGYATKNYGTDGKPKCTVTQKNVLKGINWAEVKGKHRLEKDPNVSLVITPSTKRTKLT